MRVYLADLGHNLLTKSSDTYPLGVANLAGYAEAHLGRNVPLDVAIFREPQELKAALDAAPPDVLGLANYAWNHQLAKHFAGYAKRLRPGTLTAMGGPNWPLTEGEQESFLAGLRDVDVAVEGPTYEGERAFVELLRRWIDAGGSIEDVRAEPLAGSVWIDRASGELVRGLPLDRIEDLDEIPSPYLSGLLDPWFESGYFPLLQIARGCPFRCTFCNSGVVQNSKVHAHSIENVKRDLAYVAEHVRPGTTLCFADDNFGMYKRDEELADYLAWLQDRYGWPRYIRTTTGKNNGERIIQVMRKVRGALPMTAAVQSMNPEVLENIKRSNIKLETYAEIQAELREQGMQSYGELILCLPGETRASFLKSISDFLDAGAQRISAHQLMLLHGAELSNPESIERFGLRTRFRVVARNVGDYTGEPVVEVERMVVETPTFSFDEYLKTRVFHLLLTIFHYEGNFEEAFEHARQSGVKAFDLVVELQELLDDARRPELVPEGFRRVVDDFVRESRDELFETEEECLAWSRAHYAELVDGSLGGNLLSKYSMIGRFYETKPALAFLRAGIEAALRDAGRPVLAEELDAVFGYLEAVMLHVPFRDELAATVDLELPFDVEGWRSGGYTRPLVDHRWSPPRALAVSTGEERRALIRSKIDTFGEHASGLGKFTRSMFAREMRRDRVEERP